MNENNLYVFGGAIYVGGTLDNGKAWKGYRVMLAPVRRVGETPTRATVCKAPCTDSIEEVLNGLTIGNNVYVYFDENGRIAYINTQKGV